MERFIVAGGLVVTSTGRTLTNLLVEKGQITAWIEDPETWELPILNVQGNLVLPGVVDAHTHFQMASGDISTVDDFIYGGQLAASAGVTSIIDFIEPYPTQDLREAIQARFTKVRGCPVDYQFHLVIPQRFACRTDWFPLMDHYQLAAVKGFTTYREDGLCLDRRELEALLAWALDYNGLFTLHAEDDKLISAETQKLRQAGKTQIAYFPKSRPGRSEEQAVQEFLSLSAGAVLPYFVHLSTQAALHAITVAQREKGQKVGWVETCPQYLVLDESAYDREDADYYTVCPPLRTRSDQEALWQGIKEGLVDVVASDHCAFAVDMKRSNSWQAIRPGLPAIDAILPVLVNEGIKKGRIEWEELVRVTSENPARLFRLKGKGGVTPGHDADFLVISKKGSLEKQNPSLQSKAGYSPFSPHYLERSWLRHVVRRGEFLLQDGKLSAAMSEGRFIPLT